MSNFTESLVLIGCLLTGVGGLMVAIAGVRTKDPWGTRFGLCIMGAAFARQLAEWAEAFSFLYVAFGFAMLCLAIARSSKKSLSQ